MNCPRQSRSYTPMGHIMALVNFWGALDIPSEKKEGKNNKGNYGFFVSKSVSKLCLAYLQMEALCYNDSMIFFEMGKLLLSGWKQQKF